MCWAVQRGRATRRCSGAGPGDAAGPLNILPLCYWIGPSELISGSATSHDALHRQRAHHSWEESAGVLFRLPDQKRAALRRLAGEYGLDGLLCLALFVEASRTRRHQQTSIPTRRTLTETTPNSGDDALLQHLHQRREGAASHNAPATWRDAHRLRGVKWTRSHA